MLLSPFPIRKLHQTATTFQTWQVVWLGNFTCQFPQNPWMDLFGSHRLVHLQVPYMVSNLTFTHSRHIFLLQVLTFTFCKINSQYVHITITYILHRCGQSKHCLFFPQSSPQLCGISFLFHSGLCTLPKEKVKAKNMFTDLSATLNLGEISDQKQVASLSTLIKKRLSLGGGG